jgi:hypothetical protein
MIEFSLPRRAAVLVTARGPLPSCAVKARLRLRGVRGANAIPFSGVLGKQRLEPGTYVLALRPSASARAARTVVVVTRRGAEAVGAAARASALSACSGEEQAAVAAPRFDGAVSREQEGPRPPIPPTTASAPPPELAAPPETTDPFEKVLGVADVEQLADTVSPIVVIVGALAMLAALAASIGGLVAFVRRRHQSA